MGGGGGVRVRERGLRGAERAETGSHAPLPSPPFQFDTSVSSARCQNNQAAEENKSDERKVCLAFLTPVLFLILAHKNKNLTSLFFFFKLV